jgi:hypothetical protein
MEFAPRSGWRTVVVALWIIPLMGSFIGMALSSSELHDAKGFSKKCHNDSMEEIE